MLVSATCATCGKEFSYDPNTAHTGKYCSAACYHKGRTGTKRGPYKERVTKTCVRCGKEFQVGGHGSNYDQQYCSHSCASLSRPKKLAACRQMSEAEAAWLAGLFDGEGSVVFPKKGSTLPRLSIINTNRQLILRVQEITGTGSIVFFHHENPKHSDTWTWQCYASNARALLEQMLPWLIVKREKALLALGREE